MSPFSEHPYSPQDQSEFRASILPTNKQERNEEDPTKQWEDLLWGEFWQLMNLNDTADRKSITENAVLAGITDTSFVDERGNIDKLKLKEVIRVEAKKRTAAEKYVHIDRAQLDYNPLPPGQVERNLDGEGKDKMKKESINRTLYLQELLKEMGFDYKILSANPNVVRDEHFADRRETEEVVEFYVYNLKKAVFVCNQYGFATYIIHDVFEDEVKPLAESTFRIDASKELPMNMTRVEWVYSEDRGSDKNEWMAKMRDELSRINMQNRPPTRKKDVEVERVLEKKDLEVVPEEFKSMSELAQELGVDRQKIKSTAIQLHERDKENNSGYFLNLDLEFKNNGKRNRASGFYFTEEQAEVLKTELQPYIDEMNSLRTVLDTDKSINELRKEIGVGEPKITSTAIQLHEQDKKENKGGPFLNLDLEFKNNGKRKGASGFFFTKYQAKALKTELQPYIDEMNGLKTVSDTDKTTTEMAGIFGVGKKKIISTAIQLHERDKENNSGYFLNLDLEFKKNGRTKGGIPGFFFTKEQAEAIREELKK